MSTSKIIAVNPLQSMHGFAPINKNPIENDVKGLHLVSERFAHITTRDIINSAEKHGFQVERIRTAKVRNPERQGFQKHLVILNRPDWKVDDTTSLRLLVKNGNHGGESLSMALGLFRMVCLNGLVVGSAFAGFRVRHTGNPFATIGDGMEQLFERGPRVIEQVKAMQSIQLNSDERTELLKRIVSLRLPENADGIVSHLNPQRIDDMSNDLWTVFNRAQEYLIRGGFRFNTRTTNHLGIAVPRTVTARAIKAIDSNLELNKQAWNIAESYLERGAA